MQSILGKEYIVIEEGLNGRTVLNLSPVNKMANGVEWMSSEIENYLPLDIFIISLGINDVFIAEDSTLDEISQGIEQIIDIINNNHIKSGRLTPLIIIMSPPRYNTSIEGIEFFELQVNKLKELPDLYRKLALKKKCHFFDASIYVTGSSLDGSHLEAESHKLLGEKIAEFILNGII